MNAKQFLRSASTTLTEWNIDNVVRLAHSQGYRFSAEDLETAAEELWGHLSEDQLRDIAGGGGDGRSDKGPISVDLSLSGKVSAGAWSPPPGDVSGNSCFFIRG
jgi:hypothetical protein